MNRLYIWKRLVLVLIVLTAMGGLSACNTLDGMGQDLESAGRGMQNTF
jgi:predicted small secreted protein